MTKLAVAEPPTRAQRPRAGSPASPGRVADLEAHVRSDWWRIIFDELYLKTDGDVFENDGNTRRDVDELVAVAHLHSTDRVLDLCCGQGRHAIELARRGFRNLTGIDQSAYLIALARQRAKAAGVHIAFVEADARSGPCEAAAFDCVVMLGNSFGYFERAEDDAALLRRARHALRPGGRLVLELIDGEWLRDNFAPCSWEWLEDRLLVCRERTLSRDRARLVTREIILHADRGVIDDRFFAERLYSRCEIVALLESEGFAATAFHAPSDLVSDRASDLGMMARRVLVVARAGAPRACTATNHPREIAVLLGDARLPDRVKPDDGFNAAEADAVQRLREAFGELPDYRFRIIDDHAALLAQLQSARPQLALNLCDAGWRNEATMEAHVPALLEMLGVPYTGAGPACLTLCYDKAAVNAIAAGMRIAVPAEVSIGPEDPLHGLPARFPALVKPCMADNSVGIDASSVVRTTAEAAAAVERLRRLRPGAPVLMQQYLSGGEYSIGVIGNHGRPFELLPILDVDYSALEPGLPHILAYGSKWDPASAYARQIRYRRAALPESTARRLAHDALRLFARLGCRDYARFDFRAGEDGVVRLLEVNPNPGWSWDGKLAIMAELAGLTYANLLRMILQAAETRLGMS